MPHLGHIGVVASMIPGVVAADVSMRASNKTELATCVLNTYSSVFKLTFAGLHSVGPGVVVN